MNKCGDRNMHWYHPGNSAKTCMCGQIPHDIFFATACDCGQYQMKRPVHYPDCAQVAWAKKHNEWVRKHPEVDPLIPLSSIKVRH